MDCKLYRAGNSKQMQSGGWFIAIHLSVLLCVVAIGTSCSKNPGTNQNEFFNAKGTIHETDSCKLTATNLGFSFSSPEGELNPEMTSNGLEVFFSSERVGTVGKQDLWQMPMNPAWLKYEQSLL